MNLPKNWQQEEDGIWTQTLSEDIWQLFNNDRMVYVARWPNATFEDGKIWRMMSGYRSADGGFDKQKVIPGWVRQDLVIYMMINFINPRQQDSAKVIHVI